MSDIEWIMGSMGLRGFFGTTPLKITQSLAVKAAKGDQIIQSRANEWAALKKPGKLPKLPFHVRDYDQLITALHLPEISQPDLTLIDPGFTTDMVTHFIDITHYLASHEPALVMSKGIIAREVEPPDSDKARFVWACNIIEDVSLIYDLMDAGALTVVESEVFRTLYPDMAFTTAKNYISAAIDFMYNEEKPTIASWQAVSLSALMGVPVSDFNDVLTWQAGYNPTKGPGRPPSQAPNLAGQAATESQRKDFPR